MSKVFYLMEEICAGVEVYYSGRVGGQYLKSAFILCDDYTELTSKLFLLTENKKWSDLKPNQKYKNYHDILGEVLTVVTAKLAAHVPRITALHAAMKDRRSRRNDFFHSTKLLDLSISQARVIEAFCDLMEYGRLLFPSEWDAAVSGVRNLETLDLLLQLERKGLTNPSVIPAVNRILQDWPRNHSTSSRKGVHLAMHPEDLHLRLCVTSGGKELRDKLKPLL